MRPEERQTAETAGVDALLMIVQKHATECGLGAVLEKHATLIRIETRHDVRTLRFTR